MNARTLVSLTVAAVIGCSSLAPVFAQDAMQGQDAMKQDSMTHSMKHGAMSKDSMPHGAMKGDAMKGDAMQHDAMKGDAMQHGSMKHDSMKHDSMKHNAMPKSGDAMSSGH